MDIFYVYPYLLLLEQGDCDAEKLNEASNDFIRHICRLHEGHGNRLRVFFHLQYMKFRLTVLRERYHNNGQNHLPCYCHVVGAIMYVENTMERLGTPQEDTGEKTGCPPGEGPPVLWTADAINLMELLYACHELKLFNNGEISLKDLTAHVCQTFGVDVKNASSYYARMRRRKGDDRTYFIDRLREVLLRKMDTDDERQYRRNK